MLGHFTKSILIVLPSFFTSPFSGEVEFPPFGEEPGEVGAVPTDHGNIPMC